MKWSDRTVFHKVIMLIEFLCLLVYSAILLCWLCGILPSVYELPWAQICFGTAWLCMGIDNLKISRTSAIMNFVTAAIAYLTTILGWIRLKM